MSDCRILHQKFFMHFRDRGCVRLRPLFVYATDSNVVCMLAYWYSHQELCVRWNSSVSGFLRQVMELGKAAFYLRFLADRTNGRAIATLLRLSSVTLCIVAKRCILEQKLLLRAYRKSYMRNRLVPK